VSPQGSRLGLWGQFGTVWGRVPGGAVPTHVRNDRRGPSGNAAEPPRTTDRQGQVEPARFPIPRNPQRTAGDGDLIHPQDRPGPMASPLAGRWRVVSSPDLDEDYLGMEGKPYVIIGPGRKTVDGEFRIGLLSGGIDGWYEGEVLRFTFDGLDEMDSVHGAGRADLEGSRLVFVLRFHLGEMYTFLCRRVRARKP